MMTRFGFLGVLFLALASPALADWPAQSVALGAEQRPAILQKFGGEIQNPALSAYVSEVGLRVVAVSDRPDEAWRFTVLDTPSVNAFAQPGGYVYVTRGLLALANSESELAAVLAHEVTHVIEEHVEDRQEAQKDAAINGALSALVTGIFGGGENRVGDAVRSGVESFLGEVGSYSKAQEFAADTGGIELLRRAGYDPAAQAYFLASLSANAQLEAEIAGREYDETTVPFFATHPANAERQLRALADAGDAEGEIGKLRYLRAIDGLVFGQSARGGFVDGQVFTHPELGFTFEAAQGLRIQNTARQINILGPNGSTLIMSGAPDRGGLTESLRAWAQQIPRRDRISRRIENLQRIEINGMEAATGTLRTRKRGQRHTLRLTMIRFDGNLIRFASSVRQGDDITAGLHAETVRSFRGLAQGEGLGRRETYINVHLVEAGDTVQSLAEMMAVGGNGLQWFRVLNGLAEEAEIAVGDRVKLVSRKARE